MSSDTTIQSNDHVQPETRRTYVAPTLTLLANHETEAKNVPGADSANQNS